MTTSEEVKDRTLQERALAARADVEEVALRLSQQTDVATLPSDDESALYEVLGNLYGVARALTELLRDGVKPAAVALVEEAERIASITKRWQEQRVVA